MVTELNLDQQFIVETKPSERFPVYTRANVGEMWPGPISALTYTTEAGMLFDEAWRKALVRFGAFDLNEFDRDNQEMIGVFWGYPYLNLSVQRIVGVRMPGASPDAIDASFFGSGSDVPPHEPRPDDNSPEHTQRILETIDWIFSIEGIPKLDEDREQIRKLRAARPDFTAMSDPELWAFAEPLITTRNAALMEEHLFLINASAVPIGALQGIATELGDPGLAARLISGYGGVDSAAPTWSMWDLGRLVRGSQALTKAFDAGVDGVLDRVRALNVPEAETFLQGFSEFLYEHGSRCPNEWDLAAPSWETHVSLPLTAIERMRLQDDAASPQAALDRLSADRQAATDEVMQKLDGDAEAQGRFQAALQAAQVLLPARERSKSNLIMQVHEARIALQELGRRMVEAGHFGRLTDISLLRCDEYPRLLADPASWRAELDDRRRRFDALAELEPPFVTSGMPVPPSAWRRRTVESLTPVRVGDMITGIPACPGSATGTARVIHDPSEGSEIEPGEILVAPQTDPAWTPLFLAASAVVVDVGAPLSHAAIVSRELGVPCVVSASHASRRIPTGARITVDGTTGAVTVLDLPA